MSIMNKPKSSLFMFLIVLFTPYHQVSGTAISTNPEPTTTTPSYTVSTTPSLTSAATKPTATTTPSYTVSTTPSLTSAATKPTATTTPSYTVSTTPSLTSAATKPTATTTPRMTTPATNAPTTKAPYSPPIVEVAKVSFRGSIIGIFADAGVKNHSRFFYEPLVHLDPKSIFAHHHTVLQSDVVSFTIEMWNPELRRKVLARLQSLKGQQFNMTNIGEEDIYVLPFEEVLLINDFTVYTIPYTFTNDLAVVKIREPLKSYVRQSENIQFYVICNSTITANGVTEDFRRNPGFLMQKWYVKCSGLNLGNQLGRGLKYTYPISISNSTSSYY